MLTRREKASKAARKLKLMFTGVPGEAVPAFIFGEMRSGTNMLINTLAMSRDTECFLENDEEAFNAYRLRDTKQVAQLVGDSRAKVVVFKPIADSQNAKTLLDTHISSRAVWIFRWYKDAVTSAVVRWTQHKQYLYRILEEPETAGWRRESLNEEKLKLVRHYYDRNVSDATARALIWYLRNSLYFDQKLERDDRVLLVNYEEVTAKPTEAFRDITSFLGCKYHERMTKDIHSRSVGKTSSIDIDEAVSSLCEDLYFRLKEALPRDRLCRLLEREAPPLSGN